MYKILDEICKFEYKNGAVDTMQLLNSLDIFDHLSDDKMEEIELKIIDLIESR